MKRALPILLTLVGFGSCFSFTQTPASSTSQPQSPLDSYIDGLRKQKMNSPAAEFARRCGVKLDEAAHRFAFSNGDARMWKVVRNLPEAYDNLGMDMVSTAETWKNPQGVVVEEWDATLDVGGFERRLYCFGKAGRMRSLDSTNYQIPDEGSPWGMHERWVLRAGDKFHAAVPFEFVGLDDKPIPSPKLDGEYKSFAERWGKKPPEQQSIRELYLPAALFK